MMPISNEKQCTCCLENHASYAGVRFVACARFLLALLWRKHQEMILAAAAGVGPNCLHNMPGSTGKETGGGTWTKNVAAARAPQ